MKALRKITDIADNLEWVLPLIIGASIMIGIPIFLIAREWKAGNEWISVLLMLGIALVITLALKEIKRGYLGWISGIVIVLWILISIAIGFTF